MDWSDLGMRCSRCVSNNLTWRNKVGRANAFYHGSNNYRVKTLQQHDEFHNNCTVSTNPKDSSQGQLDERLNTLYEKEATGLLNIVKGSAEGT